MTTESLILITPDVGLSTVTATEAARQRRDELLNRAAGVVNVADEIDADDASISMRELKQFADLIETQRVLANEPVLTTQRAINALARDLAAAVKLQYDRISRVLGTFEAEQRRKREDAKRKADAEAARILHDAQREADAVRRAAAVLPPAAGPEAAAKVEAIETAAVAAVIETRQAAINTAPKAAGITLRETPNFEVTDIGALFAANPTLCTVTENRRAILAIIKDNPNVQIPGIRHWLEAKTSTR